MTSSPPASSAPGRPTPERRRRPSVSLAVLAGVCVAFAVVFLQVVRPLALPLFLAAVFAILAHPPYQWLTARIRGRGGVPALVIVASLILVLLGPTSAVFIASYQRASDAVSRLERPVRMPDEVGGLIDRIAGLVESDPHELRVRVAQVVRDCVQLLFSRAVQAVGGVFSFGLGLLLFAISSFFFLKDGAAILQTWEELTPLTLEQDRQIRRQFAIVCRAVVLSTILSALAQAAALGLGLGVLELSFGLGLGKWLVLLIVLAFVFSVIPIVGPSVVWLPLASWMIYERQFAAGVMLAAFGVIVVSNVDNFVRMAVLNGSAGLHPLLGLVSGLGGLQQMGIIGVFVGPVVAGVFITLLRILKRQLDLYETPPLMRRNPPHEESPAAMTVHGDPAS